MVCDFCAHGHTDGSNVKGGVTVILTLTKPENRYLNSKPDDEQLHGNFFLFYRWYNFSLFPSRPCGFGQSIGRPIVRSFSHFFWSTKKKLSSFREFLVSLWEFLVDQEKIWSTKKKFGLPKKNLVHQKKCWYTNKKFGRPKSPRDRPKIP